MEKDSHPLGINIMNQDNQGSTPFLSEDFLVKRKRGRPKKNPRLHLNHREIAHEPRTPNQEGEDIAHSPPGYDPVKRNESKDGSLGNDANDVMVGQAVNGVIEAKFDAGYLLSVTVGNSGTTLRGVVFRPGRVAPVSAENDVAPHLPMIRRNKIPFRRQKNRQPVNSNRNQSPSAQTELRFADCFPQAAHNAANFGLSRGKEIVHSPTTLTTSPAIPRGTLVPVLLQPVELPNGAGSLVSKPVQIASQPPHLAASRSKQLLDSAHSLAKGPVPNAQQLRPNGLQSEASACGQPQAEVLVKAEARAINSSGMPFEKLLTEVIKRAEGSSKPVEAQESEPLSIKPLQSVRPDHHAATAFKPFEKIGRMTDLLQAVQENMRENQAAFGSRETQLAEKESVFSDKTSQA